MRVGCSIGVTFTALRRSSKAFQYWHHLISQEKGKFLPSAVPITQGQTWQDDIQSNSDWTTNFLWASTDCTEPMLVLCASTKSNIFQAWSSSFDSLADMCWARLDQTMGTCIANDKKHRFAGIMWSQGLDFFLQAQHLLISLAFDHNLLAYIDYLQLSNSSATCFRVFKSRVQNTRKQSSSLDSHSTPLIARQPSPKLRHRRMRHPALISSIHCTLSTGLTTHSFLRRVF